MKINAYLNFPGTCEAAFKFYKEVFQAPLSNISRFGDMQAGEKTEQEELTDEEKQYVMHVGLVLGNDVLMGSDVPKSMQAQFVFGASNYVSIHPETLEKAKELFAALSEGGEVEMSLTKMFWGAHFASFKDKFGILWMIHFDEQWDGTAAQYPLEA